MPSRSILVRHQAYRDGIGDLVTRRPVPEPHLEQIDPFLFVIIGYSKPQSQSDCGLL